MLLTRDCLPGCWYIKTRATHVISVFKWKNLTANLQTIFPIYNFPPDEEIIFVFIINYISFPWNLSLPLGRRWVRRRRLQRHGLMRGYRISRLLAPLAGLRFYLVLFSSFSSFYVAYVAKRRRAPGIPPVPSQNQRGITRLFVQAA